MNFTKTITDLFLAQRIRLIASGVPIEKLNAAHDALEAKDLDPESIDKACCAELLVVLNKRYDTPEPMSTRLDKFGWSSANIKHHMDSFLRSKLKSAQAIIREHVAVKADVNADVKADIDDVDDPAVDRGKPLLFNLDDLKCD